MLKGALPCLSLGRHFIALLRPTSAAVNRPRNSVPSRKIVYFLGAGASFGAGAHATVQGGAQLPIPTQSTFWGTFLRFCADKKKKKSIESFLFRYFLGYGKSPGRLSTARKRELLRTIDVEEVFTFLSERIGAPSTSPQLRTYSEKIWEALVSEIGHVFRKFGANKLTRRTYRALLKRHVRRFDSVVSFNYDTVFEDSLPARRAWAYQGIQDSAKAIAVLKPHGSINWTINSGEIVIDEYCHSSVVVAPSHLKFVSKSGDPDAGAPGYLDQSTAIQAIWAEMEKSMRQARALVFIGYSFPPSDLYFSSVLRSVLADRETNPAVIIVNPDAVAISQRLALRFALRGVGLYFDMAQFIQASRLAR